MSAKGLWYSKDSSFELVAYTDSDYAGATQNRLMSWQCKKQTVVATSTTEAEYVAAASYWTSTLDSKSIAGLWIFLQKVLMLEGFSNWSQVLECLILNVGDEAVHKELGDRMERAATTASSLDAEQVNDAQTRFEAASKQSNDPPLSRVNTLGSGEESMKLIELMAHCTTLSELWKFLIHTILHCLSPKKTAWEQFSSNIATAIICLATNRTFNFSNLIFEAMVKNLDSKTKFLMYPRFIQIFLNKHQRLLLPHKRTYPTPTLTQKLFSNMKRASKGYSGVNTPLFQTMLVQDQALQGEGPTIPVESHPTPTSPPSTSQQPSSPPSMQTTHVAEEAALMPHESPLPRVHSLGSDEGSLSLNELTVLCTSLSKKVESLESELKQTKQTYSTALTKLIKRGRSLIEELDMDTEISLVPSHVADQENFDDTQVSDQPEEQLGVFSAAKVLADAAEQRRDVGNVQTYTRRRRAVSTASELVSTAGVKAKDKGKAIMQESEPPKKIKKRVQVQMSIDEELAQKAHEEEQSKFNAEQEAKFMAEQEQERLDHETAMKIQEELDAAERQRMDQVHQAAQGFTDDE
ncbi:hypothetical protein Tco_1506597 [Tanacetum coccineum]